MTGPRHTDRSAPAASDRRTRRPAREREGIALILVLTAVAILSVMLAEMHESTSTALAVAVQERDALQAEYAAQSAVDLTRLLVAQEPLVRQILTPMYQAMVGRKPPQLPVWSFANQVLRPFCDYDGMRDSYGGGALDFGSAQGLGDMPAKCSIVSFAENSKINVNRPLGLSVDDARLSIARQLYTLMGGYQSPSPYDPLFAHEDPDGLMTTRLDIVSAVDDWWDEDTEQTHFDPTEDAVTSSGPEQDVYARFADPYHNKNAPFDSVEELRLVRGVSDDFWATFVQPTPSDPQSRTLTVYGSGAINPNEAPPAVLLARVCSFIDEQPLCVDPLEQAKFIQILDTARALAPIPYFTLPGDFLNFLEGKGGKNDLYPTLTNMLGKDFLFTPLTIPSDKRTDLARAFVTGARILSIIATGTSGRARVRLNTVVNFDERWTPPPPNAGSPPKLGVFDYYRVE